MRVDLFHTGTSERQEYSLDEVVKEPQWPGTRRYLLDPFNYGSYRFRVIDAATQQEIFRQGYSTLFEEWSGTAEAVAGVKRTMSESVRFPWPRSPVVLRIDQRDKRTNEFNEIFALRIDPASHLIVHARPDLTMEEVDLSGGPVPSEAMDVLVVPEGYTRADEAKLRSDLQRFASMFLSNDPWKDHRDKIHVRGLMAYSRESGVSEPRKGIYRDTLLGASFNTFDSARYLTVTHTKKLRQLAARAPYDTLLVMVNSARYGGGGVFNQWAVFTSDNEYDDYLVLHEYGHSMGGLGDEYYDSTIATDEDAMYPPGLEPWEPNITAFVGGRREAIKWHALIAPGTPVPTPDDPSHGQAVGLFEGAGYKAKGLYRPQHDCKMFHKGTVPFCQVCRHSLASMVRYYAGEELR